MPQELGRRLREARRASGLGQEKVAESIGSHPVTISKYERGVQDPSTDLLKAMAMLYGVSVDWLLGGKVLSDPGQVRPNRELPSWNQLLLETELALRSMSSELTPGDIEAIRDFIRFVHSQRVNQQGEAPGPNQTEDT